MEIHEAIAVVTGANRGLGKAYTEALLAAGAAKVYAGARNPASVNLTDPRIVPLQLDVTKPGEVEAAAQTCEDATIVINNAGIMKSSPMLSDSSEAALREEMEVNVYGMLRMVRAFAPVLGRNGGGAFANMLSVVSWFVYPFNATYCASKHAALALTEGVRIQLKAQGTQVVAVYAGFIDTDMASGFNAEKLTPQQVAESTLQGIREHRNDVIVGKRAEDVYRAIQTDPARLHAQMQEAWDVQFG